MRLLCPAEKATEQIAEAAGPALRRGAALLGGTAKHLTEQIAQSAIALPTLRLHRALKQGIENFLGIEHVSGPPVPGALLHARS
jgi:hypothetical protein